MDLGRVSSLRGRLSAGDVAIGHVAGTAEVDGGTAGVRIGEIGGAVRYVGSAGPVRIGHARADVDLSGAGGSFTVGRTKGTVRNSLPEPAGESADHVKVHARTRLDDIVIHPAHA